MLACTRIINDESVFRRAPTAKHSGSETKGKARKIRYFSRFVGSLMLAGGYHDANSEQVHSEWTRADHGQ